MNILITSYKGGVGKSSIGYNMAVYLGYRFITNDIISNPHPDTIQIDSVKKRIPKQYCFVDQTIFDFGAMSTQVDPKLVHAEQLADLIVIPCNTDHRSLQATVNTHTLMSLSGKPIVIIINNFTKQKKFDEAKKYLRSKLVRIPIFAIRSTTLFDSKVHFRS